MAGFILRARAAEAVGRPSKAQWQAAFSFACATEQASPYWIGDLLQYLGKRTDWEAELEQLQATAGAKYALATLDQFNYISKHVKGRARALAPTPSHAREVASLKAPDQVRWLERAQTEGWTRRELRRALRGAGRQTVVEGQVASMHTVEVTVRLTIEAETTWQATDRAWALVKQAIAEVPHAHVIGANATS